MSDKFVSNINISSAKSDPLHKKAKKTDKIIKTDELGRKYYNMVYKSLSAPKTRYSDIPKPPIIVEGNYNGSPITVYGETHDLIDNEFYEKLNLRNTTVFVEHETVLCNNFSTFDKDVEKIFKKYNLLNMVKGSQWILYKYRILNLPVVCIDIRMERGLLTGLEEKIVLGNLKFSSVLGALLTVLPNLLTVEVKQIFQNQKNDELYNYFKELTSRIHSQRELLFLYVDKILKETNETDIDKIKQTKNMINLEIILIKNIGKLSAMIVDIHIKTEIEKYAKNNKPIAIFVGAGHAYRLHKFFPEIFPKENIKINNTNRSFLVSIQKMYYDHEEEPEEQRKTSARRIYAGKK